jgi:hypothetical protein
MIGLIDVGIRFRHGLERVTLAYYRSSGINSGKIQGLWYPIVGVKTHSGEFTEFTNYLNYVLTNSTSSGGADKGWLAKSLFFMNINSSKIKGFSNGSHYITLFKIGKILRYLYENNRFYKIDSLDGENINDILTSNAIYQGNKNSQKDDFEEFVSDIFEQES